MFVERKRKFRGKAEVGDDEPLQEEFVQKDRNSKADSSQVCHFEQKGFEQKCLRAEDQQSDRVQVWKFENEIQKNRNEKVGPSQECRSPDHAPSHLSRTVHAQNQKKNCQNSEVTIIFL